MCTQTENIDNNQSNDDTNDFDADEIKRLLIILSNDRVNNYDSWSTIGMVIYNETRGWSAYLGQMEQK